jgi:hypothetical protein
MRYINTVNVQPSRYNEGMEGRGSIPNKGNRLFSTPQLPGRLWAPPSFLPIGLPPSGVKWYRHEPDYSLPSRAEEENGGAIPALPICLNDAVFN